jgi:hypothetical protein
VPNDPKWHTTASKTSGKAACQPTAADLRTTHEEIKNLPPGKYDDDDGTSFPLRVAETNARLWTSWAMVQHKQRERGLGGYATVTSPRRESCP